MDYKNLFITCSTLNINKEKRDSSIPSKDTPTETITVTTDGFDLEEDLTPPWVFIHKAYVTESNRCLSPWEPRRRGSAGRTTPPSFSKE